MASNHQLESIVLGGGCFWCLDAAYKLVKGVVSVMQGYAGGVTPSPTTEQVYTGATGHAEVVQLQFDPKILTLSDILDIFWTLHDPTSLNRQGPDIGPEYRSIILYSTEAQKRVAEASIQQVAKLWDKPIVTELKPLDEFYPAEEYHQNYFNRNPNQGYCSAVVKTKVDKFLKKFSDLLKSQV